MKRKSNYPESEAKRGNEDVNRHSLTIGRVSGIYPESVSYSGSRLKLTLVTVTAKGGK